MLNFFVYRFLLGAEENACGCALDSKLEPGFDSSANQYAQPQRTTVEDNPWSS